MYKNIFYIFTKITFLILAIAVSGFYWVSTFMPDEHVVKELKLTQTTDLPYLQKAPPENRGKILALVTSERKMGTTNKKAGYELTELSRAYWVFKANGFDVDIASPKGGKPRMIKDGDDMNGFDYAFINDTNVQAKLENTFKVEDINPDDYEAIYIVGGKGAMFDFPDNTDIQHMIKEMYQDDKVISAVCHGPAALVNVKLDNGEWLVSNAKVSAFTNDEELFLIPDAKKVFPFLLEDELMRRGASFDKGDTYLEKVSANNKLITGQNPWSVWRMSENVIEALGYVPVSRELTPEENSINVLMNYEKHGLTESKDLISNSNVEYQQSVFVMHSFISIIKMNFSKSIDLLKLAQETKKKVAA